MRSLEQAMDSYNQAVAGGVPRQFAIRNTVEAWQQSWGDNSNPSWEINHDRLRLITEMVALAEYLESDGATECQATGVPIAQAAAKLAAAAATWI